MGEFQAKKRTVLVAGSQPARQGPLVRLLAGRGYDVQSAGSARQALALATGTIPDLILLDTGLQDMSAYELCQRLRAEPQTSAIPILFAGDARTPEQKARIFAAGGTDYVSWPLQEEELFARVETHLSLQAMERLLEERTAQLEREVAEREHTAEALQEAEARGRELIENLSDVIFAADETGIVTYVSPAIEPFLGYSPPEVVDRPLGAFVHPEDLPRQKENLGKILAGRSVANEYRILTKAGDIRWVRTSSQPVFEAERVIGLQGVLVDITELKQAEERIRHQNEFLTTVLESLTHPFYVIDVQDYTVEIANSAARQSMRPGRSTCYALTHDRDMPCADPGHPCPVEEIKRTKQPATVEHIHYDAAGQPRNVEIHGYPLFDGEGNVARVIEYSLDVTERKRAEEALREAKEAADEARRQERERRQEAERRRRVAEGLAGVLAALNSNQSLGEVLDYIVLQAVELLDNQAIAIYRREARSGALTVQAAQNLSQDYLDGLEPLPGQEFLKELLSVRGAVSVPDLTAASGGASVFSSAKPLRAEAYRALLAVPLIVKDEVYGGMVLYYAEPRQFTQDQIDLAAVFGDQVALAIENARLQDQLEEAAATAERNRLARDLHDSVTQALFSASLVAEVLPQVWQRDPVEAREGLDELRLLTRGALAEMRTMLLELRPTALVETRLHDLLWQLTEAVTARIQILATFDIEDAPCLPPEVHVTFYRVAQEALHNVVKHAEAGHVTVSLHVSPPVALQDADAWHGQVILQIRDDGQGFDPRQVGGDQLGLGIMRERADAVGALLSLESQPDRGTVVTLVWRDNSLSGSGE